MKGTSRRLVGGVVAVALTTSACADAPSGPNPDAPYFTTTPVLQTDHNRPWSYTVGYTDPNGDPVRLVIIRKPGWAAFDSTTATLSGTPGWNGIGIGSFFLTIGDGTHARDQIFTVTVERGEIICDTPFGDPATSPYALPFRAGETYTVIQGNCPPDPAFGHHNWFAYDFDMANGDTILASRGGRVLFTREDRPNVGGVCGEQMENFVFIEHDDGTVMHYMHLFTDGVLVSPGETVTQGQPIGLSGNSGCSSGPHLHVALFRDQTNFDRQSTLPVNYSNADGPLDAAGGLVQGASYTALDPGE